ncbi:MAG TPA: hypothetical protein RMH99_07795 [Sandaracinaceae bacterium LLY-WYZ-13_1]|nr:hypothetical protein [Sandaracinaceae bacterium LLY-WYZ-13_1]
MPSAVRGPSTLLCALTVLLLAACEDPGTICDGDGGTLPRRVTVSDGQECVFRSLSVPSREVLGCGALPESGGARVRFEGRPGAIWRVTIDRSDGTPGAICAAVLDAACQCTLTQCTDSSADRLLVLDLDRVDEESLDLFLAAGTYDVELCAF